MIASRFRESCPLKGICTKSIAKSKIMSSQIMNKRGQGLTVLYGLPHTGLSWGVLPLTPSYSQNL